jgi:hypothetical protein
MAAAKMNVGIQEIGPFVKSRRSAKSAGLQDSSSRRFHRLLTSRPSGLSTCSWWIKGAASRQSLVSSAMEGPTMPLPVLRFCLLLLLSTGVLAGCGYFQKADSAADDEFADFDKDEKSDEEGDDKATSKSGKIAEGELELKLNVGERFPLQKRIEQRLTQGDGLGGMIVNRSLVEMMLSLVVEEVRDGNKLLSVRYHKIHYGHNIAGRTVEYNSESSAPVPTEALVYSGLKNNGFSFWIGPDNRIVELVGFPDFLQRCVQNVPAAHRDVVMRQLEGTHGEDGLSNFVDDGIGLLPYSNDPSHPAVAVKIGSSWDLKPRRSESGAPISIATRCVLKNLTESSAEITLLGKISGSMTPVATQDNSRNGMQVMVKGGHCAGSCTIDRRTGLPTQSEVNRYLELVVKLPDGVEIPQRKEVLTTTTSFLNQGAARETAAVSRDEPGTLRASGFGSESNQVTQAVGQADSFDDHRGDSRSRSSASRSRQR